MKKNYIKKVSNTLLIGLVIILVLVVIYAVYPKYEIESVRVDDETIIVTRLNKITGEVNITSENYYSVFDKYASRLQNIEIIND
jgi:hypothetical protein